MNISDIFAKITWKVSNKILPKIINNSKWSSWANSIESIGYQFYKQRQNHQYNFDINGEAWLIKKANELGLNTTIFDVGANTGDWSIAALETGANIHAFEICPPTFKKLESNLAETKKIKINNFGLSNQKGKLTVHYCSENDELSSMVSVVCSDNTETIDAEVCRGDQYCIDNKIEKIDFLKIDVEGGEPTVLEGFANMLNPEQIPLIQFEYGMVNIEAKFLLLDFYKLLTDAGYKVGKLYPDYVKFKDYEYSDENFLGPNYVAASPEVAEHLAKKIN